MLTWVDMYIVAYRLQCAMKFTNSQWSKPSSYQRMYHFLFTNTFMLVHFLYRFSFLLLFFPTSKNSGQDFHASQVHDPGGSRMRFFTFLVQDWFQDYADWCSSVLETCSAIWKIDNELSLWYTVILSPIMILK